MSKSKSARAALRAAFPHTVPVLTGFGFLGLTYGVYMSAQGFNFLYPFLISLTVFGGSLQFVAVNLLLGAFAPLQALAVSLALQARHLFYGISMLDRFKGTGAKKPYLIFGMCDESFAINHSATIPDGIDRGWFMFWVTLLNQSYWVIASALGGLLGSLITFDTTGIDFVMTAMFVVILLEQILKERSLYTAAIGVSASLLALVLFGADKFLIPAMIVIIAALSALRRPLEKTFSKQRVADKTESEGEL